MEPIKRLCEQTHDFCKRAISGEFGKALANSYCAIVTDPAYPSMTRYEQYNACVKAIVEQAPIRLLDGELLSGSATFDLAREHKVPAATPDNPRKALFGSKSHLTPHYQKVLKRGIRGLEEEIDHS